MIHLTLFQWAIALIVVGLVLCGIGSSANFNWEGGSSDWWGVFGLIGLLALFGGVGCLCWRIVQVLL